MSLAPGVQIILKIIINVVIKRLSSLHLRNQEHSPFPCVLVYCCCEDTPEGQASGRKDWLLFPVSGSPLYGQLAPFVWGQKCGRISSRELQKRGTFGPGDKICSQSHGPLATYFLPLHPTSRSSLSSNSVFMLFFCKSISGLILCLG